jgi:hypothetical protein
VPGPARGRGTGRLNRTVTFQLLPYRVEIALDEALEPAFRVLANSAEQPVEPRSTLHYAVAGRGPYAVSEEGDHLSTLERPPDVVSLVSGRCQARLLDHLSLGSWVAIRAGVVRVKDRRALIVGDKGVARTALLLRLLQDGHAVEGDALAFIRGGQVVCLPRHLEVEQGAAALVPELAPVLARSPSMTAADGAVVTAVSPEAGGAGWRLDLGPVDVGFVLRSGHQAPARCRPITAGDLVQAVVGCAVPTGSSGRHLLRSCSELVGDADGYELTVGDVIATADLLAAACS